MISEKDLCDPIVYINNIVKVAYSYLKSVQDAEDIAQEVYLSYYNKKPKFSCEEHMRAWLFRVTINKCKNYLKSSWRKKVILTQEETRFYQINEEEKTILNAVLSLDEKYRLPIHLFYYEGYSIKEIADILKINSNTIGSYLSRGRKVLKEMIGDIRYE